MKRWPKLEELDLTVDTQKWYDDLSKRYPNYRSRTQKALNILAEIRENELQLHPTVLNYLDRLEKALKEE